MFVPDTGRRVGFLRHRVIHLGTLDADGNFHESERIDRGRLSAEKMWRVGSEYLPLGRSGTYTRIGKWGPAYEYRAGKLVEGVINTDGELVPDPQAPVIRSQDAKYSPTAVPIWNRPGYFKKKEPPADGKDAKK